MTYLDIARIRELEALASDILADVYPGGNIKFPVDLGLIAKQYGIKLEKCKFADDSVVGQYSRNDQKIMVSENANFPRMAFTIAHELGHHFLHKDTKNAETFYRLNLVDLDKQDVTEEKEANIFAANLLMPSQKVYDAVISEGPDSRPYILAKTFGVSHSAILWRLKTLGIEY